MIDDDDEPFLTPLNQPQQQHHQPTTTMPPTTNTITPTPPTTIIIIITKLKNKLTHLHKTLTTSEISGSLGDLGTLLPLLIGLSRQRTIALAPALFFGGISNILTGLTWDVPMCVQPMKSIAAVALSSSSSSEDGYEWDVGTMAAAGIVTGGMVLVLGGTGLIEVVNRVVPRDVVSGLQIGVGLRLAGKGIRMVAELGWIDSTNGNANRNGYDTILLGIICSLFCMFWLREATATVDTTTTATTTTITQRQEEDPQGPKVESQSTTEDAALPENGTIESTSVSDNNHNTQSSTSNISSLPKKICLCLLQPFTPPSYRQHNTPHPVGVYLFLLGVLFAIITLSTAPNNYDDDNDTNNNESQYDLPLRFFGAPVAIWAFGEITKNDWKVGLLEGAIPQLPLTTLNSVISVCALAHSLYPPKRRSQQQQHVESNSSNHTNDDDDTTTTKIPTRKEVAISVGLLNLLFCPFGSMPNCHGAGGLAGQHRLGARHGTSVVFLGIAKVGLAVLGGRSALTLLDAFPSAVLGVMLAIAGQELATTGFMLLVEGAGGDGDGDEDGGEDSGCDLNGRRERVDGSNETMRMMVGVDDESPSRHRKTISNTIPFLRQSVVISTITAMVIVTVGKTHYGALSGWVAHMIYGRGGTDFIAWCRRRRRRRLERD